MIYKVNKTKVKIGLCENNKKGSKVYTEIQRDKNSQDII